MLVYHSKLSPTHLMMSFGGYHCPSATSMCRGSDSLHSPALMYSEPDSAHGGLHPCPKACLSTVFFHARLIRRVSRVEYGQHKWKSRLG